MMKNITTIIKGAKVNVYQKHLTNEDYEGLAKIVSVDIEGDDEGGSYCTVRFYDRDSITSEDSTYGRWVHARHIQP